MNLERVVLCWGKFPVNADFSELSVCLMNSLLTCRYGCRLFKVSFTNYIFCRPYSVPSEVLAALSQHCETSANRITKSDTVEPNSNRADAIATGLDSSLTDVSYPSSLSEWWNSLFGRSPHAEEYIKESCLATQKRTTQFGKNSRELHIV